MGAARVVFDQMLIDVVVGRRKQKCVIDVSANQFEIVERVSSEETEQRQYGDDRSDLNDQLPGLFFTPEISQHNSHGKPVVELSQSGLEL